MEHDPLASSLTAGSYLGRYELLCPVAQGAMAEVWVARLRSQGGFERLVAVKTILASMGSDERFRKMFLDEGRIAAAIRHSNVAQVIDLGEEAGMLYQVHEWIEGDSLTVMRQELLHRGETFPLPLALKVISQACAGLHAGHELTTRDGRPLGVVHRDISPANILVTRTGQVKVIDFGIVKALDRLVENTDAGSLRGKIGYMAPEQAEDGANIDRRADIWAMGAVLYHIVSGRHPYAADNELAMLHRLLQGDPPEPIQGVPDEVRVVFERSLAPRVEERFRSAEHMHVALETALAKNYGAVPDAVIGRFVQRVVGPRIEARQERIERALVAAHERSVTQRRLFASEVDLAVVAPDGRVAPAGASSATPAVASATPPVVSAATPRAMGALGVAVRLFGALVLVALGYLLAVLTRG